MLTASLSAHTGTEISGLDLREAVPPTQLQELQALFAQRSVLVFRCQSLTPAELLDAVQQFGEVFEQQNTRFSLPECPLIHYLSNEDRYPSGERYIPGAGYHTDHSNDIEPPKATVLHAVALPSSGGDTQFVNMHEVYEALPTPMRSRIEGLEAEHVYQSTLSQRKLMGLTPQRKARIAPSVWHPLVRTHPQSGRKSLYLNPIRVQQIGAMQEQDTRALLHELLEFAMHTQFEYRHRWQAGDIVMWDNRCLLHKANGDYDMSQRRYLYRVMLKGTRPC
jgi:taurine dioxygenase